MSGNVIFPAWFLPGSQVELHRFEPNYRYLEHDQRVTLTPEPPVVAPGVQSVVRHFPVYPKSVADRLYSPLKFTSDQLGPIFYGAKDFVAHISVSAPCWVPLSTVQVSWLGSGLIGYNGTTNGQWSSSVYSGGDDGAGNLQADAPGMLTAMVGVARFLHYAYGNDFERANSFQAEADFFQRYSLESRTVSGEFIFPRASGSKLEGSDLIRSLFINPVAAGGERSACFCKSKEKLPDNDGPSVTLGSNIHNDPWDSGTTQTMLASGLVPGIVQRDSHDGVEWNGGMTAWAVNANRETVHLGPGQDYTILGGGLENWLLATGFIDRDQYDVAIAPAGPHDNAWTRLSQLLGFTYEQLAAEVNSVTEGAVLNVSFQLFGSRDYKEWIAALQPGSGEPAWIQDVYSSGGYVDEKGFFRPMFKITVSSSSVSQSRGGAGVISFTSSSDKTDFPADTVIQCGSLLVFGQEVPMWADSAAKVGVVSGSFNVHLHNPDTGKGLANRPDLSAP